MLTVAQIFIDDLRLRIKRSVPIGTVRFARKFKHRTNVSYPYHYENTYRTSVPYFLAKIDAYRTVLPSCLRPNLFFIPYISENDDGVEERRMKQQFVK